MLPRLVERSYPLMGGEYSRSSPEMEELPAGCSDREQQSAVLVPNLADVDVTEEGCEPGFKFSNFPILLFIAGGQYGIRWWPRSHCSTVI